MVDQELLSIKNVLLKIDFEIAMFATVCMIYLNNQNLAWESLRKINPYRLRGTAPKQINENSNFILGMVSVMLEEPKHDQLLSLCD